MGKGSAKQEVTDYYMSIHYGISVSVDSIHGIYVGEKTAWEGTLDVPGPISINQKNLFGGNKKEGGLLGTAYFLPGRSDQVMPEYLSAKVGLTSATMPAYRGVATLWFTGSTSTVTSGFGGLVLTKTGGGRAGFMWSSNNPYLRDIWMKIRRILTRADGASQWYPEKAPIPRGVTTIEASHLTWRYLQTPTSDNTNRSAVSFNDSSWPSGTFPFGNDVTSAQTPYPSAYGFSDTPGTTIPPNFRYWIRTHLNLPSVPTTLRIQMYIDDLADIYFNGTLVASAAATLGSYYRDIEVPTSALVAGDNVLAVRFTDTSTMFRVWMDWRLIGTTADAFDMNPAHIIYECLTDTSWGMGAPSGQLDDASFRSAADTLFTEGFGLSLNWTRQTTIEAFVGEILDHIQATLFINPRTGLWTIKLIRDDYDIADLPVLNRDNCAITNFDRKGWGETTNEIVVTWTNPQSEKEETVYAQDLANVTIQGAVVSDSRNYYAIRSADLAMMVAKRDLRMASAPLAIIELEVSRDAWNFVPGGVIVLDYPEPDYDIDQLVLRISKIDYGRPGDPTIKVSTVEDIFSLPFAAYGSPPTSEWVSQSELPRPMDFTKVITAPLYFTTAALASSVDSFAYPDVMTMVMAAQFSEDTFSFDLVTNTISATGETVETDLGIMSTVGHGTTVGALAAEAVSTGVTFSTLAGGVDADSDLFVFIGNGAESAMEIALLSAYDEVTGWTLARGLFDTVPRAWPAGTVVWLVAVNSNIYDETERAGGESVTYKLLSRTSLGTLSASAAPAVTTTLTDRPWLPNRPGNVKAKGVAFGSVDIADDPTLTITWANRNRLMEPTQAVLWTDATITPEAGQTTRITVMAPDRTVLQTHTGLTGASYTLDVTDFGGDASGIVRVTAERDGLESLQGHEITVTLTPRDARILSGDAGPGALLPSGDAQSGTDIRIALITRRVPAGDMNSGSDRRAPAGDMQSGGDIRSFGD